MKKVIKIALLLTLLTGVSDLLAQDSFTYNISGTLSFEHVTNASISVVHEVVLHDINGVELKRAAAAPSYSFKGLNAGQEYVISVENTGGNLLYGLTSYDIVPIGQHVMATSFIEYPFTVIAADINMDNTIALSDAILLRRLILNMDGTDEFKPYRYVPSAHNFPPQTNPSEIPEFPETIQISNLSEDVTDANFIVIKVGETQ